MSSIIATVSTEVLRWARQRTGLGQTGLANFLKLKDPLDLRKWELTGEIRLSLLEKIAKKAYIPIGYMFLSDPPDDSLPIPDYRKTTSDQDSRLSSSELLDTIRYCQFRQDWFEKKTIEGGSDPLDFVNTLTLNSDPVKIAESIRMTLGISHTTFHNCSNWEEALRIFVRKVESVGVLVMRSGIAGSNTRRKLKVSEFRGFTLNNKYCPLIFINSNDAKSAQMFTLAHELAHVWLGQSGVSNITFRKNSRIETFCNQVASNVLVPNDVFIMEWGKTRDPLTEARRIARVYKVSSLVVLIKALQNKYIDYDTFIALYRKEKTEGRAAAINIRGGNFYLTQGVRLSKTFMSTVIMDTHEGNTTYVEAFQLLGIKNSTTFNKMSSLVFNSY